MRVGTCHLGMAIDHVVFDSMIERAREYRRRVDELGIDGSAIDGNVLARLRGKPETADLPRASAALVDEIVALLDNHRLSPWQAHELCGAFRGANRGGTADRV